MGLFVKVGTIQELEALEAGKLVEAAGQRTGVFNVGGKYWAIEDTCPHRGGPLSEGILADEVICPWHGSRFNLKTGAVRTSTVAIFRRISDKLLRCLCDEK